MTLDALLIQLRARGAQLTPDGDMLKVSAAKGGLSNEVWQAMKELKPALMRLPLPYINEAGELIMPHAAPPQYHWQSKEQTLRELKVTRNVWQRNMATPYPCDLLEAEQET